MLSFEAPINHQPVEHQEAPEPEISLPKDYRMPTFNSAERIPGDNQTILHPEIMNAIPAHEKLPRNMKVQVAYNRQYVESTNLDDYLSSIGSDYESYESACESMRQVDNKYIFLELHKRSIAQRHYKFIHLVEIYEREGTEAEQRQAVSTREHSAVWDKYFNDLGIHGLRSETTRMEDYLDGIDQYIVLDSQAMLTDGEEESDPIYIGVQRSFDDKSIDVSNSPLRYIPEHLDLGPIYRVYWQDRNADYHNIYDRLITRRNDKLGDEAKSYKMSYLDYVDRESKKLGISKKEYLNRRRLSAIERVLPGGHAQQYKFVLNVLTEAHQQLQEYFDKEQNPARRQRLQRDLEAVTLAIKKVRESREQTGDSQM